MGEYVLVYGEKAKIGTCQEAWYVRYHDIRALANCGALTDAPNSVPVSRFFEDGMFRWRFPYPSEDQVGAFMYDGYEPNVVQVDDLNCTLPGCRCERGPSEMRWQIVAQVLRFGDLRVVVRCSACRESYSLDRSQAVVLAALLYQSDDVERHEVARRLLAGYGMRYWGVLEDVPDGEIDSDDMIRIAEKHWYMLEHGGPIDVEVEDARIAA